ncbi:hypothetical protein BDGGKGIB_00580 [Nodularia sphaerocarpa UHCC 0038]|nr:hypothetical protein [Nodularia sphaerocarpa]MDB9375652.1 hypothetical protein [Nodularia sphaerocarpa CS-585]MDB9379850.1 hypothetical protein [Nodularia sphaerocarpa CS-585A2]ULP70958.1 hypothetical protein BDGGKGIB_00580 [Nodularia sphaerocarpa UHCC 0038]
MIHEFDNPDFDTKSSYQLNAMRKSEVQYLGQIEFLEMKQLWIVFAQTLFC